MTVQELIDLLMAVEDKTGEVWADGCDCCNPVIGVDVDGNSVTMRVDA